MVCSLKTGWLRLPVCEHAILNVALQIQPTRPCPQRGPPPQTGPTSKPRLRPTHQNGLVPKSPERCSPRGKPGFLQGDVEFRSRVVRSDVGYCDRAVPSPVAPLPPLPSHPSSHLSLHLLLFLCKRLCHRFGCLAQSGALLADALARAAHFAVQLHHLEDSFLAAAAQMVKQAVVLLGEAVEHAEHVACKQTG